MTGHPTPGTGWLQLTMEAPAPREPELEAALYAAGALAVTVVDAGDQPLLEPAPGETPLWDRIRITGLFAADSAPDAIRDRLQQALGTERLPALHASSLEDRVWERAWMDHFRPARFGQRLWVVPWGMEPPEPDAVNLRLDPGLAFGTGSHPTTRMCLEWLAREVRPGDRVLDFGCGSGILSIAALLLGADSALAVDIDPQALAATAENARRNGVEARIRIRTPEATPQERAGVLVANILAGPLVALAPRLGPALAAHGRMALSGILEEQTEPVRRAYAPWVNLAVGQRTEGWVLLEGAAATPEEPPC